MLQNLINNINVHIMQLYKDSGVFILKDFIRVKLPWCFLWMLYTLEKEKDLKKRKSTFRHLFKNAFAFPEVHFREMHKYACVYANMHKAYTSFYVAAFI